MSVAVDLEELQERLAEYGPVAFLLTVGDAGPHAVSVRVAMQDGAIRAGAGRTTARNVGARPALTLLWPALDGGSYSLIVDGTGAVQGEGDGAEVVVEPVRAVLHRVASATADGPSCITVLDRRPA